MTEPFAFDMPPDYAGQVARCPQCSTTLSPVAGPGGVSVTLRCGCGNLLEAWPAGSTERGMTDGA